MNLVRNYFSESYCEGQLFLSSRQCKHSVTYFQPKLQSSSPYPQFVEYKRVTCCFLLNINVTVFPNCPEYCKVID